MKSFFVENKKAVAKHTIIALVSLGAFIFIAQTSQPLNNIQAVKSGEVVFGPELFLRSAGKPVIARRNFNIPDPSFAFWIQIKNGENGNNLVSSAVIRLNGENIFSPQDFNQRIFGLSKEVNLRKENVLEVELRSVPNSFLTVTVRRTFPNPNVTNAKRDFSGLNDGESVSFAWSPVTKGVFEYVLFVSESPSGLFTEVGRSSANRSPNAVHNTPDARIKDLCYKLEARDISGGIVKLYETICVPKFTESQSHEVSGLKNRTASNTMCLQENQFINTSTMSLVDIREFIASRNSFLQGEIFDVDNIRIDPAQIIFDNAQNFQINPQIIIATAEKEQEVITATERPDKRRLELFMGFCPNDPETGEPICKDVIANPPRTIRDQIRFAASQFRLDIDRLSEGKFTGGGWKVNFLKRTTDGIDIIPKTKAVATLFSYTPEAGRDWGGNNPVTGGNLFFCSRWALFDFPIPPQPVTLNPPTDITATSLKLSWTLPQFPDPDFLHYKIFRSTTSGVTESNILVATITNQSQTEFTNIGLTSNTTFFYRIFTVDQDNLSTASNEISVTTSEAPPPQLPVWPMFQKDAQRTGLADVSGPPFATSSAVTLKWQKSLNSLSGFPLLVSKQTIYVGTGNSLLAFNKTNGNQIWQASIPTGALNGALGPDGTIYVCGMNTSQQSVLTAVNPADGAIKWQFIVGLFRPCNAPAVAQDGTIFTTVPPPLNTQTAVVVAVNPDGTEKWRHEEGNTATTPPSLSNDESQVYVGFRDTLKAFNAQSGQVFWNKNVPVFPLLITVDSQDQVLNQTLNGPIIAFSKSGTFLWQSGNVSTMSLYPGNKIFTANQFGFAFLNSSDGSFFSSGSWPGGFQIFGNAFPVVDKDGIIYIPLAIFGNPIQVRLFAFDSNGNTRWNFDVLSNLNIAVIGGSALNDDGTLYFLAQGLLLAF